MIDKPKRNPATSERVVFILVAVVLVIKFFNKLIPISELPSPAVNALSIAMELLAVIGLLGLGVRVLGSQTSGRGKWVLVLVIGIVAALGILFIRLSGGPRMVLPLRSSDSAMDNIAVTSAPGDESKDANAYFKRGVEENMNGDVEGAIRDFSRALELNPKDAAAYDNRGSAKQAKGDLNAAIADFDRALELDPKDAVGCYNRGNAQQAKGDLSAAIADFDRALELAPKSAVAYYNRGNAKLANGNVSAAIADYSHALELNPEYARAYYNRSFAKSKKGDSTGATDDYNRAIKLDPSLAKP